MKWIRFTVENASETKTRADSTSVETALAAFRQELGWRAELQVILFASGDIVALSEKAGEKVD